MSKIFQTKIIELNVLLCSYKHAYGMAAEFQDQTKREQGRRKGQSPWPAAFEFISSRLLRINIAHILSKEIIFVTTDANYHTIHFKEISGYV